MRSWLMPRILSGVRWSRKDRLQSITDGQCDMDGGPFGPIISRKSRDGRMARKSIDERLTRHIAVGSQFPSSVGPPIQVCAVRSGKPIRLPFQREIVGV